MRCDCIARKVPGKCKACAPKQYAAMLELESERKKHTREVEEGCCPSDEEANVKRRLKAADVEPTTNHLESWRLQALQLDQEKAKTQSAQLTNQLAVFGVLRVVFYLVIVL